MGRYHFVEGIALADCAIDVEGADLPDLFETAALALADVMVDPATVPTTTRRTITLDAAELDLLLYDWLSELIFRKDRDAEVYTRAKVAIDGGGPFRLVADVEGGVLDPARTELRSDAKAVTFHQFALERAHGGWRARIVIDI
ncbi:MAG TPA: archease [Candidatus Binatia bacterium]|nr:archease [Candidatus Binatia bacterium]